MSLSELSNLTGALDAVGGPMSGFAGDLSSGFGTAAGFEGLVSTSGTGARLPGSLVHARLGLLEFAVNPAGITLNKQAETQGNKTPLVESAFQESVRGSSPMTIDLTGIQLVGPNTMDMALYLISLATPVLAQRVAGLAGAGATASTLESLATTAASVPAVTQNPASIVPSKGGKEDYILSVVEFVWGMRLTRKVTVKNVNVKITRFSGIGVPISAEVTINLLEWETLAQVTQLRQNPTSGGLPGRAMHTVTAGDSIVRLAVQTYGDPSAWRAVAVANGLDDPLRLEPGQELYLPGPGELSDVLAGGQGLEVNAA